MASIPIVVGVGDFKNRSVKVEDAIEPLELILRSIKLALEDTGLSKGHQEKLQSSIDSIAVVATWTWPYSDLSSLIGEKLGVDATYKHVTGHGGDRPAKIFDEAARQISQGQSKVAIVTGGEALASLSACAKEGKLPPPGWTKVPNDVKSVFSPTTRDMGNNLGATHDIGNPISVYPLYENGFRAYRKQTPQENTRESASLYASFAKVAETQPYSWNYGKPAATADIIGTVSKNNRMIMLPYPLLMNAFNTINIAGACILTSTKYAEEIGISESKWIYPLGGAGTKEAAAFWNRPEFYSNPSISRSFDAAFEVSGISKDEVDIYDFYSCFPIVPKLACHHLGLSITEPEKPITLLGGLTSFGGAGNNYSMHALTEMVRQLRAGRAKNGCVLANGGVLSYQYVVCLSSSPRSDGSAYPERNPLPDTLENYPCPEIEQSPRGPADIEVCLAPPLPRFDSLTIRRRLTRWSSSVTEILCELT